MLSVTVDVNGETVADGHAINTGEVEDGYHIYDYHVSNDGDVARSGKIRHDRNKGTAALASKLMRRVEQAAE